MLLVRVARSAVEATSKLDTRTLLDDVRCFVRCQFQGRRLRKRDVLAEREGLSAEVMTRLGSPAADMSAYARDIVLAECGLDRVREWKRLASAYDRTLSNLYSGRLAVRTTRVVVIELANVRCCTASQIRVRGMFRQSG